MKSAVIAITLTLLGVGAFGFGAVGGGAALATPKLVVTNPGQSTSWHPATLPGFNSNDVHAGGIVREQFAIENTGASDMTLDMGFTPGVGTARYIELTLHDLTANKVLYKGPIGGASLRGYDVGQGVTSRRVFQVTLDLSARLPAELGKSAASPGISIEAGRAHGK